MTSAVEARVALMALRKMLAVHVSRLIVQFGDVASYEGDGFEIVIYQSEILALGEYGERGGQVRKLLGAHDHDEPMLAGQFVFAPDTINEIVADLTAQFSAERSQNETEMAPEAA